MKLISVSFEENGFIPLKYSGYGDDISPELTISDIPTGTQSLVLVMEDPDSPGKVWQHWLMWNIAPTISVISEDTVPTGAVEGSNDFGRIGYGGPKPNVGTHHYQIKLLALNKTIDLPQGSKRQEIDEVIKDLILESTQLVGLYSAPSEI